MYQFSYAEILDDSANEARDNERRALDRAVELLAKAGQAGPRSRDAVEAIFYVRRLWDLLMDDLASPENDLPAELRAGLISIGIWIIKQTELLRLGKSEDFKGIRDICAMIRDGLK